MSRPFFIANFAYYCKPLLGTQNLSERISDEGHWLTDFRLELLWTMNGLDTFFPLFFPDECEHRKVVSNFSIGSMSVDLKLESRKHPANKPNKSAGWKMLWVDFSDANLWLLKTFSRSIWNVFGTCRLSHHEWLS